MDTKQLLLECFDKYAKVNGRPPEVAIVPQTVFKEVFGPHYHDIARLNEVRIFYSVIEQRYTYFMNSATSRKDYKSDTYRNRA